MSLKMYGFWLKMVWVMGYGRVMGFGADFSGNEHGGSKKVWVTAEYGGWQLWVISESTVHKLSLTQVKHFTGRLWQTLADSCRFLQDWNWIFGPVSHCQSPEFESCGVLRSPQEYVGQCKVLISRMVIICNPQGPKIWEQQPIWNKEIRHFVV